ncbi:MAG TPA: MauE/DoxX family redox-associated membrane protein [Solirubrobacteraceae bacterium]
MILDVAQLALGLVFAGSAWAKLREPRRFVEEVRGYAVLPRPAVTPFAWVVMALEPAVALALLTGVAAGPGAAACAALLATFAVAVAVVLRRGADVSCGCFGADDERVSRATAVRLAVLSVPAWALAIATLSAGHAPLTLGWVVENGAAGAERFVVAGALASAALVAATIAASARPLVALWRAQRFSANVEPSVPPAGGAA